MRHAVTKFFVLFLMVLSVAEITLAGEEGGGLPSAPVELSPTARTVFEKFSPAVIQVKVLEKLSGVKAGLGSGFYASADGLIVTNFHVISEVVFRPAQYRVVVRLSGDKEIAAELLSVDVIHDLALLKIDASSELHLKTVEGSFTQGSPIFSMGTPHDLELTIVEGLYNGPVQDFVNEKFHVTASINPGMSGGPTVNASGEVVGVNVSGLGEQVSFLVPARFVKALVESYSGKAEESIIRQAETQLLREQDEQYAKILAAPFKQVDLGGYSVPSSLSPGTRCWSKAFAREEDKFSAVTHRCDPQDHIYLKNNLEVGCTHLFYTAYRTTELNAFQFSSLIEQQLKGYYWRSAGGGDKEDLTPYRCDQNFITTNGSMLLAQTCLRAYKKLPSLHDFAFIATSVDSNSEAVLIHFFARGINIENAKNLAAKFIEGIRWNHN